MFGETDGGELSPWNIEVVSEQIGALYMENERELGFKQCINGGPSKFVMAEEARLLSFQWNTWICGEFSPVHNKLIL